MGFFARRIQQTCLRPSFSLRVQMILSFGITAAIAIMAFVLVGLYTTVNSGDSVRVEATKVLTEGIQYSLGRSAQYVAETMAKKFHNIGGAGSLVAQVTKDRFVGYPSMRGWEEDNYVPFQDVYTKLRFYPIDAEPLPLDWNLPGNINPQNVEEHMPGRKLSWYPRYANVSSVAGYFMQGTCDPQRTDPTDIAYYEGCTDANNDLITGGVVQPTETNYHLANKGKDIVWMLKALYESHFDVRTVGVYFANDGAGSTMRYPGNAYNGVSNYNSTGCQWMEQIHPRTNKSIATPRQIRRCHDAGTEATMREYNPLERKWCRDMVERDIAVFEGREAPEEAKIQSTGPYKSASAFSGENVWVMTFGEAVFDIRTDEFIACTLVDASVSLLYDMLKQTTSIGNTTKSALIRYNEQGTVIVANDWDPSTQNDTVAITHPSLNMGIDDAKYNEIRSLQNYDEVWDPDVLVAKYRETILETDTKVIMTHPVPSIPSEYDPSYYPVYFVIITMEKSEAYGVLLEMDRVIARDTQASSENVLIVGGAGFGVILLFVGVISGSLTKPLRWIQKVSGMVVDSCGESDMGTNFVDRLNPKEAQPLWSPNTEVTLLLAEFLKMIHQFSGVGATDVAGGQVNEVKNRFEWRKMYEASDLYPWGGEEATKNADGIPSVLKIQGTDTFEDELTTDSTLRTTDQSILSMFSSSVANSQYGPVVEAAMARTTSVLQSVKEYAVIAGAKAGILNPPEEEKIDGPPKVNLGENIIQQKALTDYFEGVEDAENSGLFWWMTFFIGTPIVIAAIMIAVTVARDSSLYIPNWLAIVEERSKDIELQALITATNIRAAYGEEVMHRFARDLHVYTRLAGWLFFDGIRRTDFMAFQTSGSEQCKNYNATNKEVCPFLENETLTPCPCGWDDPWGANCTDVSNFTHPRYLMHRWYEGLSTDADSVGDRFNITWPGLYNLPSTTDWWNDTNLMPGSSKGEMAAGYETTYDRVRVGSALSVADFPIYNYFPGKGETGMMGTYVGFEADGMFTGFSGCETYAGLAWWQSTEDNGGFKVNGTLCPNGKFGFDARCRGWYGASKQQGGDFHITPPYLFASSNVIGMSAGAALIDPRTGTLVGVTLIDFSPSAFVDAINENGTTIGAGNSGFPILITPQPDELGSDTLVGPGFVQGEDRSSVTALVLPYDSKNSTNWKLFERDVLQPMRSGVVDIKSFTRTTEDGNQQELYMAVAPVNLRSLVAVNHSDFLAGITSSYGEVYALGFGITLEDIEKRFLSVENKVQNDINRVTYISLALIIFSVLMVMYMTYTMAIYLAEPILLLVGIVKNITANTIEDELPKLEGGSYEITNVYYSLEKLCKIVRFTNAAHYKGDRTKSYKVLEEALDLFNLMGNQKAVGVANNNLGTMVLQEQMERSSSTSRSAEVYQAGMKYFEETIRIGTFEYQNADFDDNRGDYVKQLANRYFNRGMFYIVNKQQESSFDLVQTGISDLKRAKTLDAETYLYWTERGQLVQKARTEFFCYLRRARGIMTLMQVDPEFEDCWGVEALISRADDMLHNPDYITSNLFENVGLVARKQQINDLRIQWALIKKDNHAAATMAMKILVEDEYVIDTVLMNCVTTLNTYFDLHGQPNQVPNLTSGVKRETRRGQVDSLRQAKNVVFCLDYSGSMAGERMKRANANLKWIYQEHCLDKDYVGFARFNHAVDDKLYFDLARKGNNQDEHLDILGKALDAEGGTRLYAALNKCVNMCQDSGNDYDCWIIALTDGESAWDFPAKQVITRISKHNKQGGPQINVVIIGFEVPSQVAESVATITSITEKSLYIDARGGLDEMDNAFEQVAAVITGTAITMETF
ncbi:expressed unknown protein [Seminavis robusta]|uniref:VWFA domain-containing protein n=1 Tax=Seminavis robusta TaxID=568900 RepID=A0A9N8DGG3_9STRA|nr:expressed unknown protein [Seminavis robusta]|eukprot:Sro130_g061980.1 n/a (1843) ;mRNA; r:74456-81075